MKPVSIEKFNQKIQSPILNNSFDEYSTEINEVASFDDNREMTIASIKELFDYVNYSLSK